MPVENGRDTAATIPGATLVEITSKSIDPIRHAVEFKAALAAFLARFAG